MRRMGWDGRTQLVGRRPAERERGLTVADAGEEEADRRVEEAGFPVLEGQRVGVVVWTPSVEQGNQLIRADLSFTTP